MKIIYELTIDNMLMSLQMKLPSFLLNSLKICSHVIFDSFQVQNWPKFRYHPYSPTPMWTYRDQQSHRWTAHSTFQRHRWTAAQRLTSWTETIELSMEIDWIVEVRWCEHWNFFLNSFTYSTEAKSALNPIIKMY